MNDERKTKMTGMYRRNFLEAILGTGAGVAVASATGCAIGNGVPRRSGILTNPGNGPVIENAELVPVFLGDWSSSEAAGYQQKILNLIQDFISTKFRMLGEYGVHEIKLMKAVETSFPGLPAVDAANDNTQPWYDAVGNNIDDQINKGIIPADKQLLLFFSPDAQTPDDSVHLNTARSLTPYCVFPYASDAVVTLHEGDGVRNGMDFYDFAMTHEVPEMLTDPYGNAWYGKDSATQEIGDLCAAGNGNTDDLVYDRTQYGTLVSQGLFDDKRGKCSPSPGSTQTMGSKSRSR